MSTVTAAIDELPDALVEDALDRGKRLDQVEQAARLLAEVSELGWAA